MMLLFCVKIFFYNENKPNTLPIELISIIKMQIGAKYFKKKLYSFFLRKFEDISTYSEIFLNPTILIIRIQVERAAIGIIIEFVKKSKKSKNDIPKIFTKSKTPYPSDDAEPITSITTTIKRELFLRLNFNSSEIVATLASIMEIALVKAASKTSKKKVIPAKVPTPILAKVLGNVINISEGPACNVLGSPPEKANTAGIIIIPAKRAIPVSNISICVVDFSISTSLPI